jgi:hypothetical protein
MGLSTVEFVELCSIANPSGLRQIAGQGTMTPPIAQQAAPIEGEPTESRQVMQGLIGLVLALKHENDRLQTRLKGATHA